MKRPVVLVVTRSTVRKNKVIDYVGEYHLELLIRLRTLPIMIPVVAGTMACLPQYAGEMRGLLLVEGEDIEPKRYTAEKANFKYLEKTHPLKDEIEIRLLRHALAPPSSCPGNLPGIAAPQCGLRRHALRRRPEGKAVWPQAYQLRPLRHLPAFDHLRPRKPAGALVPPEESAP